MVRKVWIDMTTGPHVLFFEPLIRALQRRVEFLVTTRPYQHTVELLEQKRIDYKVVGRHHGRSLFRKAYGLLRRSISLWKEIMEERDHLSFSFTHDSPYCSMASYFAGLYNFWTSDNERATYTILSSVRFANKVIVPEIVPKERFARMGTKEEKIVQYPGLKEEVYLWNFKPNKRYLEELGIETEKPVILMRPEASKAAYVRETDFLVPIIESLKKDHFIILLPRSKDQELVYRRVFGTSIFIPTEVLDGPNVMAGSSLIISAGGTMNREAVVLGKKVISTYREDLLTVDKWLIKNRFMLHDPNPDKEFVERVIEGEIEIRDYQGSDKPFNFFLELMRKGEAD